MIKTILLIYLGLCIYFWISALLQENRSWNIADLLFLICPIALILLAGIYTFFSLLGIREWCNWNSKIRPGNYFDNLPKVTRHNYVVYKICRMNLTTICYKNVKTGKERTDLIYHFRNKLYGEKILRPISKLKGMLYDQK